MHTNIYTLCVIWFIIWCVGVVLRHRSARALAAAGRSRWQVATQCTTHDAGPAVRDPAGRPTVGRAVRDPAGRLDILFTFFTKAFYLGFTKVFVCCFCFLRHLHLDLHMRYLGRSSRQATGCCTRTSCASAYLCAAAWCPRVLASANAWAWTALTAHSSSTPPASSLYYGMRRHS